MRLLRGADLTGRLATLLRQSRALDVAVAYCCPGSAVEWIVESGLPVRAIIGIDDAVSSPAAIRLLVEGASSVVRLGTACPPANQRYHPKVYIFHSRERTGGVAWIGSANLTAMAFGGGNEELCLELPLATELQSWFEAQWHRFAPDLNAARLLEYEIAWKQHRRDARTAGAVLQEQAARKRLTDAPRPSKAMSWSEYFARLNEADSYWRRNHHWSVFGESFSYLDTLLHAHVLCTRESWDTLTDIESSMLMPRSADETTGAWGLLGSMGAAAKATSRFRSDARFRNELRERILPAVVAPTARAFRAAANAALRDLPDRVGPGVITRLLTLARPDLGISVNNASATELGIWAFDQIMTRGQLGAARRYETLLAYVHDQPWHASPPPASGLERLAWDNRAALLDALVYTPE